MLGHMITVYVIQMSLSSSNLYYLFHSILLQSTFDSECDSDIMISESEFMSTSNDLSSTIQLQGEESFSHPTSHLSQRSLPLTTPICIEHSNIHQEGMLNRRYEFLCSHMFTRTTMHTFTSCYFNFFLIL